MQNILNDKYQSLLSNTRYFIVTGGRGSGKSYAVTAITAGLTFHKNQRILFSRYTMTSAHISIIPEFIDKIERMKAMSAFAITKTEIINTITGSSILFRGLKTSSGNQTANLKSLQGLTTWILDEAEELTDEDTFDKIDLSIREQSAHNRVILILNPTTKEHWIYKRFFESKGVQEGFNGTKDDTTYIHTTYLDNIENLDQSFINQVERMRIQNQSKYNHVIMGGWLHKAEGLIFPSYEIAAIPEHLPYCYGQDYGFSVDPTVLVRVAVDEKLKHLYIHEEFYDKQKQLSTSDIYQINNSRIAKAKDLIIADSAEPRLISELKQRGLNIEPCEKKPGSVSAEISRMQEYKIFITPESTNAAKELNNYRWNDKKAGIPVDSHNHCFRGDTLIKTINGEKKIKDINIGDLVLTSNGYKRVLKLFNNGKKQLYKYSIQCDTFFVTLYSTKEHKVKTKDGWKQISQLQPKDLIYLLNTSTMLHSDYILTKDISVGVQKDYIERFGNIIMVISLKIIMFIILMAIHIITKLKTLLWFIKHYIVGLKEREDLKTILNMPKTFIQKELKLLKNGINQKMEESGIQNMENQHGLIESTQLRLVNNAELNIKQDIQENQNFVITTARLRLLEQEESTIEEVYDIMVDECHEYFANGVLVHNCIDAARYAFAKLTTKKRSLGLL